MNNVDIKTRATVQTSYKNFNITELFQPQYVREIQLDND